MLFVIERGRETVPMLRVGDLILEARVVLAHVITIPGLLEVELGRPVVTALTFFLGKA
jgi:hypothetical protein